MTRRLGILVAAILLLSAATAFADGPRYRLNVEGLACPFCAYGIEKELGAIKGVAAVETHIKDGVVVVAMEDGARLDRAAAKTAVEDAGFTLGGFRKSDASE